MAEDQVGNGLSNTAKGVFSIPQDPYDTENAAAAVRLV